MRFLRMLIAACCCAVLMTGCGDGMLKTKGRVIKNGGPFTLKEDEDLGIFFYPLNSDGSLGTTVYPAFFNAEDSTFHVTGTDRKGMPPGKYRVALEHKVVSKKIDLFKGAFNMTNSPLVFDVDSSTQEIVIDLDKPSS